ncbi:hypothetical protein ACFYYS_18755 [Streptomyces sp. NPDC002120]|uniref:hypothetical protein n=1 Tax=Streptomyces sp. NPDC002120 TaxID=3364631 RepID=UPI00367F7626
MKRLADDVGLSVTTAKTAGWVASRRLKEHRRPEVASYALHRAPANAEDDDEWFAAILTPPDGKAR